MKKNIFIGLIIIIVIISSYFLYANYKTEEQIVQRGTFLSNCNLENYDECINRIGMKSGPWFEVCWNGIQTFEDANPKDCVYIVTPLNPQSISVKQLQEFKNYLNKEVEVSGIRKTIKWGSSEPNCNMAQIGCIRDINVFVLEKIKLIDEK